MRKKLFIFKTLTLQINKSSHRLSNPEVLRSPIIFQEPKLLVRYNSEEMRKFKAQE